AADGVPASEESVEERAADAGQNDAVVSEQHNDDVSEEPSEEAQSASAEDEAQEEHKND
ncbi:MAG TPA: cell division protein, partial [Bifidobacterium sp.]|nr:cell division protein [Bifidobacterium sp.]